MIEISLYVKNIRKRKAVQVRPSVMLAQFLPYAKRGIVHEKKSILTPAEIARTVIQNMILSAPATDLNALVDLKQLENSMIETLQEMSLAVPHDLYNPMRKH